jgi:hypothetical protein
MRPPACTMRGMTQHFSPWRAPRPCWFCTHYVEMIAGGSAALCALGGVRAMPVNGCAFWGREVGADDEVPVSRMDDAAPVTGYAC